MIYPTRAAILLTAAGAPVAALIAVLVPGRWYAGLAWPAAVILLACIDALGRPVPRAASARIALPPSACVGTIVDVGVTVALAGVRRVHLALGLDSLLGQGDEGRVAIDLAGASGRAVIPLTAVRRGTAHVSRLWLRWRGSFGLVWKQRVLPVEGSVAILPDINPTRRASENILRRHALEGLLTQRDRGDGSEFDALVEYRPGMDRRAIDWKQSARHTKLHAKDFRPERNGLVLFAIDSGRQMSEPVAGLPRVDRAVSAALLAAWVALKIGDRVALFAFDSRPRLSTGAVSGTRAFATIQRLAARIDYSADETNHSFALTTLAGQVKQRALIVMFTEFADVTGASLTIKAATRLAETHLLLFVVLIDEELETIVDAEPVEPDDVVRAVTAGALLRERKLVLNRLRHLGAHVVEAPHEAVGERLVATYLDLKRRNRL